MKPTVSPRMSQSSETKHVPRFSFSAFKTPRPSEVFSRRATKASFQSKIQTSSPQLNSQELTSLLDLFIAEEEERGQTRHSVVDIDGITKSDSETDQEDSASSDDDSSDCEESCSKNSDRKRAKRLQLRQDRNRDRQLDQFLVLLGNSLQEYGCPTAVMEKHMNRVAEGLGRPTRFSFFNGYAFASWQHKNSGRGQSFLFGTWSGLNVSKLQLCDELARHVASYSQVEPTLETSIYDTENYSFWWQTLVRYLGGTLYGIHMSGQKTDESATDPESGPSLKSRILFLASVGPNVFKNFKKGTKQIANNKDAPTVLEAERPSVETVCAEVSTSANPKNSSFSGSKRETLKHIQIFTSIAVSDALSRLKQIRNAPPLYPSWISVLTYGLKSAGSSAIFFGGGWTDVWASLVLGCLAGGIAKLCSWNPSFKRISEFSIALMVGLCCRLLVVYKIPICIGSTTMSSIIQIVQGNNITLSIMELASKHPGAGVSRLGSSMTITALIGIGLAFGDALALGITKAERVNDLTAFSACGTGLDAHVRWMIFVPIVFLTLLDLNAHPRQFFFMALISAVAQVVYTVCEATVGDPLSSFIAAFTMGTLANLYGFVTFSNPIVGILAGLQVLVPGTLAVRAFASKDVTSGVELAASVLVIALSLGLGLFLGSVVAGGVASGVLKKGVEGKERKSRVLTFL
ncbi:hypothetical protein HDU98_011101 [Podochytrium sp. JEL0797]|nr:hypothetical protein HDU98_011101 [Podochytrium sp. JEL0797]